MHFKTFTQTSKCLHLPLNKSIPTLVIMDNDPKPNYRSFKTLDPAQSTGSAKCLTLNSYYGLLVNMYSLSFYLFKILFSLQLLCVQVIKPISLNGHTRVLTTSIHLQKMGMLVKVTGSHQFKGSSPGQIYLTGKLIIITD